MRKMTVFVLIIFGLLNFCVVPQSIAEKKCRFLDQQCKRCKTMCREIGHGCIINCALDPTDPICKTCIPALTACLDDCTKK